MNLDCSNKGKEASEAEALEGEHMAREGLSGGTGGRVCPSLWAAIRSLELILCVMKNY